MKTAVKVLTTAALVGASFVANAKIIEVKYAGTVTASLSSGGLYAPGSAISGSLFINTLAAPTPTSPIPALSNVDYTNGVGLGSNSNFVTGFASNLTSEDFVYIVDDTGGIGDYFELADFEYEVHGNPVAGPGGGTDYFLNIWAESSTVDFISGLSLDQTFSLISSPGVSLLGELYYTKYELDASGNPTQDDFDLVEFELSSLMAAAVPEPGALALFALGLAGLGASRRVGMKRAA